MFADIPAQPNAAERIYYPVADNKEPIICILKDKEQPHVQVLLFNKHEAIPDNQKGNVDYLIQQYAKDLISSMLNARLNELHKRLTRLISMPERKTATFSYPKPRMPFSELWSAKKTA